MGLINLKTMIAYLHKKDLQHFPDANLFSEKEVYLHNDTLDNFYLVEVVVKIPEKEITLIESQLDEMLKTLDDHNGTNCAAQYKKELGFKD